MVSGFGESTSRNGNGDVAGNFECNICLDLAQDPIVTLCGHLFCWSCLYKWLHLHSQSQECPVCKALVQVDKLVPLYGRGQSSTDPRSKSIHGDGIPDRPSGQRPETAPSPPPPQNNHFHHQGFGVMGGWGGFTPVATARFGNFPLSAAVGGLIPSFLNFQMRGFANAPMYGAGAGYSQPYGYGYANPYHGVHPHVHHRYPGQGQQDNYLKMLLLVIAVLLLLTLVTA